MKTVEQWHSIIGAESSLPLHAAQQLRDDGFTVIQGPEIPGGLERLSAAYDRAVATADPADVRVSNSTRVTDFVNRGRAFDDIYMYPPLLAACCLTIGRPFKLSGSRARTLEPGAPCEGLHVDVKWQGNGWPIVGYILMVDAFTPDNGATRFLPGTHLDSRDPREVIGNPNEPHANQVLACGPAGSLLIFNGSVWHSHTANKSKVRRRSIQGHFIPRDAAASVDHAARMQPETRERIGERGRYILDVERAP